MYKRKNVELSPDFVSPQLNLDDYGLNHLDQEDFSPAAVEKQPGQPILNIQAPSNQLAEVKERFSTVGSPAACAASAAGPSTMKMFRGMRSALGKYRWLYLVRSNLEFYLGTPFSLPYGLVFIHFMK